MQFVQNIYDVTNSTTESTCELFTVSSAGCFSLCGRPLVSLSGRIVRVGLELDEPMMFWSW